MGRYQASVAVSHHRFTTTIKRALEANRALEAATSRLTFLRARTQR